MNIEQYECQIDDNTTFTFYSKGEKVIKKIIKYESINLKLRTPDNRTFEIYNLGFGDEDEETKKIKDNVVSNNGDGRIVFNTVLNSIPTFISAKGNVGVSVKGSDDQRHRVYHKFLSSNIEEYSKEYSFYGIKDNRIVPFVKNEIYENIVILPNY